MTELDTHIANGDLAAANIAKGADILRGVLPYLTQPADAQINYVEFCNDVPTLTLTGLLETPVQINLMDLPLAVQHGILRYCATALLQQLEVEAFTAAERYTAVTNILRATLESLKDE